MNEILKLEIQTICLVHIVAIVLAIIFVMIFYTKASHNHATRSFLVMQISVIGWMIFKIFKTVSPTEITRWWFIVAYYFCACVFEVSFLEFSFAHYKGYPLKNKYRITLTCLAIMQFFWILTNPLHHLFYATYNFFHDSFGPLFYVHSIIIYIVIIIGYSYNYITFKRCFKHYRWWYQLTIGFAILFPLFINFLYISKALHRWFKIWEIPFIFDVTPIMFVMSTLIFVYVTFNYDYIDISPVMRHEIVHKLDTAIGIADSNFDIIYTNAKLSNILGDYPLTELRRSLTHLKSNTHTITIGNKTYALNMQKAPTLLETQHIVTLVDITDYYRTELALSNERKRLININNELKIAIKTLRKSSKVNAKRYVARELHDIIGHSLVVAIKLLEVAKLYQSSDQAAAKNALTDARIAIASGIDNMQNVNAKGSSNTTDQLKTELTQLLKRVAHTRIDTHLNYKARSQQIDPLIYDTIYKACQELITNTLKHAQASHLIISLKIAHHGVQLLVMDNGNGCKNIVQGNGLKGLRQRLKSVNGTINQSCEIGEGVTTTIAIPLNV